MSCLLIIEHYSLFVILYQIALPTVNFVPPKSQPKGRHYSSSHDNDKLKKHRSNGPKDKKQKRPPPIIMYIVGEALTLRKTCYIIINTIVAIHI